jgi:hypothetical protein
MAFRCEHKAGREFLEKWEVGHDPIFRGRQSEILEIFNRQHHSDQDECHAAEQFGINPAKVNC